MKVLKFVIRCVCILLYAIMLLLKTVVLFWQNLKGTIDYAIVGFFYPIIVSLIAMLLFEQKVDTLYAHIVNGTITSQGEVNFLIILCLLFFAVMIINSIVQLFACIIKKNEQFRAMFNIQKTISTYVMTILSLGALWVASMIRTFEIASSKNLVLFVFGTFYFVSSVFTDGYWYFIMEHKRIEEVYQKLREQVKNIKQNE